MTATLRHLHPAEAPVEPSRTEDPAVPYLTPKTLRLPIPEVVAQLTHLPGTARKVLIAVCQLHELKGRGCFARNETLAQECATSERSVTRYLAELKRQGLIMGEVGAGRNMEPAGWFRTAYLAKDLATVTAFATEQGRQGGEFLAKVARLGSQSGEVGVDRVATQGRQGGYHITSNSKRDNKEEIQRHPYVLDLTEKLAALAAKLEKAEAEVASLKDQLEVEQNTVGHETARYVAEWEAHQKTKAELERVKNPNKGKGKLIADVFIEWYTEQTGIEPPMLVKDYTAALTIFNYLKRVSLEKSDQGATNSFRYILSQWSALEGFNQKQPNLASINSNLSNIIATLKNGKAKPTTTASGIALTDTSALSDALRRCKELGLD